jgi:hypothetical protein
MPADSAATELLAGHYADCIYDFHFAGLHYAIAGLMASRIEACFGDTQYRLR